MKKKTNIKIIVAFILGAIIFGGIGVYAAVKIQASEIEYNDTPLDEVLDDLYLKSQNSSLISSFEITDDGLYKNAEATSVSLTLDSDSYYFCDYYSRSNSSGYSISGATKLTPVDISSTMTYTSRLMFIKTTNSNVTFTISGVSGYAGNGVNCKKLSGSNLNEFDNLMMSKVISKNVSSQNSVSYNLNVGSLYLCNMIYKSETKLDDLTGAEIIGQMKNHSDFGDGVYIRSSFVLKPTESTTAFNFTNNTNINSSCVKISN